ncbi:uncharacterized protein Ecym_2064 [Eremothecium cymbalariae DBVPG|uniref:Uncharacterized protein n=1 Tax=Eremothecium cymbalariae (strain CBS 270.75 / DBVPG 7215 / KCTC 17166 / NRRL Y-17582) TaxID=931890 RepID=G8JP21_ERECY|nr:Hypothetical protein Ecym_2064 [Eremothecium cymbalariae DBVPG\
MWHTDVYVTDTTGPRIYKKSTHACIPVSARIEQNINFEQNVLPHNCFNMLYNKTDLKTFSWSIIKNESLNPRQMTYALYLPQCQKGKPTTETKDNVYVHTSNSDYEADIDYNSGSDSAASVYSLLGVSPLPSPVNDSLIPWEEFINEIKDFEIWLQDSLAYEEDT